MGTFGDFISRLRNYSKMTQEQLAEKMEVSKTTIQNWESGRTKVKSAHLKKLAYLFNVYTLRCKRVKVKDENGRTHWDYKVVGVKKIK